MEALVALGSNIDADTHLPKAVRHVCGLGECQARSSLWRTAPHGPVEGGPFLNAVLHIRWHGDLDQLRHALQRIERAYGRRPGTTWKARALDLDVVAVREPPRKGWTLVDGDVADKPFLLRALAEVAPTLNLGNRTVADLAKAVPPDEAQVVELRGR